jgi:hypothetical protein
VKAALRKLVLTAHVIFAVGWLGAVVAYLALAVTGLKSQDSQMVRAAYLSMELVGWKVIVPLALATLVTGLIQSLGTEWGLFRHYWIAVKFVLTVFAIFVLIVHMRKAVAGMAQIAAEGLISPSDLVQQRGNLVFHPAGGLLILLMNALLSFYKPWGMTPYGRRKQEERRKVASVSREVSRPDEVPQPIAATSAFGSNRAWWAKVVGAHVLIVLVVLAIIQHVTGGGLHHH